MVFTSLSSSMVSLLVESSLLFLHNTFVNPDDCQGANELPDERPIQANVEVSETANDAGTDQGCKEKLVVEIIQGVGDVVLFVVVAEYPRNTRGVHLLGTIGRLGGGKITCFTIGIKSLQNLLEHRENNRANDQKRYDGEGRPKRNRNDSGLETIADIDPIPQPKKDHEQLLPSKTCKIDEKTDTETKCHSDGYEESLDLPPLLTLLPVLARLKVEMNHRGSFGGGIVLTRRTYDWRSNVDGMEHFRGRRYGAGARRNPEKGFGEIAGSSSGSHGGPVSSFAGYNGYETKS